LVVVGLVYFLFVGVCFYLIGCDNVLGFVFGEGFFMLFGVFGFVVVVVVCSWCWVIVFVMMLLFVGWFIVMLYNFGLSFLIVLLIVFVVVVIVGVVSFVCD